MPVNKFKSKALSIVFDLDVYKDLRVLLYVKRKDHPKATMSKLIAEIVTSKLRSETYRERLTRFREKYNLKH